MKRFLYPLLRTLLLSAPDGLLAGTGPVELGRGRVILRGSDGVLLDAPYLSTQDYIVDKMLDLVKLRDGDVVYDLGCGDGRIIVAAARRARIRGIGIDIDPGRIAESHANARAAHVSNRVSFLKQDLFDTDLREATVVTICLLTEVNLRLRPKLFRELVPGTRIVSHNFGMGDWKPDEEVFLSLDEHGFHDLYVWVVPANASGLWTGRHNGHTYRLSLRQRFQGIEGTITVEEGTVLPLTEGAIMGEAIHFTAGTKEGQTTRVIFEGTVKGDVMEGVVRGTDGLRRPWKATRDPSTVSWIE
jgi:SAM-dependent methyltransferase